MGSLRLASKSRGQVAACRGHGGGEFRRWGWTKIFEGVCPPSVAPLRMGAQCAASVARAGVGLGCVLEGSVSASAAAQKFEIAALDQRNRVVNETVGGASGV